MTGKGEKEVATVKELDGRVVVLETRIESLEALIQGLGNGFSIIGEALGGKPSKTRKTRKKREYTEEERATIRARLVAGKKAKAEERARAEEADLTRLVEKIGGEEE